MVQSGVANPQRQFEHRGSVTNAANPGLRHPRHAPSRKERDNCEAAG
jgi:hypothetical protein